MSRDLPALKAVADAHESGQSIGLDEVVDAIGFDRRATARAIDALIDGGYIDGMDATSGRGPDWIELHPLERGRRAVGLWPNEEMPTEVMVNMLLAIASKDETPEEDRSKLQALAASVSDISKQVIAQVMFEAAKLGAGMI